MRAHAVDAVGPPPVSDAAWTRPQLVTASVAVVVGLVLRWWGLGGPLPSFDESFTAAYAQLPLGDLPAALRQDDAHPPLDYLLRHPLASHGAFWLRFPSALAASLTLVLVVWWMRRRGWFGVAVVASSAVSVFQVLYAHQARMYALAVLAGTGMAVAAERWLHEGGASACVAAGGLLLVGLFTQTGALLVVVGLLALPGLRTDREAWWWRAAIVAPTVLWAAVWGSSFLEQLRGDHSSWIPFTSPSGVADAVNGFVTWYDGAAVVATIAVMAGGVALLAVDRVLARMWIALFAVPLVLAVVLGLRSHLLLARTLAPAAWAVPLALAALVELARRRGAVIGTVAVVAVALLVLPSVRPVMTYEEASAPARHALREVLAPGDAVALHPTWLWPFAAWDLGVPRSPQVPPGLDGLDAFVVVADGGQFSGRLWVLQPDTYGWAPEGMVPCPALDVPGGDMRVTCFEVPPASAS